MSDQQEYEDQDSGTPLPEVLPVSERKISVTFERKVGLPNYGNLTARAWVEGTVAQDANESQVSVALGGLFTAAAAAVFDQLGLEYIMDDDGVIREANAPLPDPEQRIHQTFGATQQDQGGNGGGSEVRVMNPADQAGPLDDWLVRECGKLGITAVWDNRRKATGNQPHYKEAVPRGGTGHGKDGDPKAFWPPKPR